MIQVFEKKSPPNWVVAFFKQIDDKSFGSAFDVLADDIDVNFGVFEWHGRKEVVENLAKFDGEMETKHILTEYWDGGAIKILNGVVEMTSHKDKSTVKPCMAHFFYMEDDLSTIKRWVGAVGPVGD